MKNQLIFLFFLIFTSNNLFSSMFGENKSEFVNISEIYRLINNRKKDMMSIDSEEIVKLCKGKRISSSDKASVLEFMKNSIVDTENILKNLNKNTERLKLVGGSIGSVLGLSVIALGFVYLFNSRFDRVAEDIFKGITMLGTFTTIFSLDQALKARFNLNSVQNLRNYRNIEYFLNHLPA